ncbi:MAG: amidohydrolase family protein [Thermodesulfobacteria bacterium]|nr:amidohydrolase family protein [Thermodesulfobacteriota bacterium]
MEIRISSEPTLYRAKFVVPVVADPIEDGALITSGREVWEVGPYKRVKKGFLGAEHDLGEVILMPSLVNVHTHLELSALKWRLTPSGSFVGWVKSLLRARSQISAGEAQKAAQEALKEMWHEGIGLVGDVGNTGLSIHLLREGPIPAVFFREVIDFTGRLNLKEFLKEGLEDEKITLSLAPHSPYTVSPVLLQAIKSWTRRFGLPFSIHVAESPEEVEFLLTGTGPIRLLLEERGQWNPNFKPPKMRPIPYLDRLKVLDAETICVHLVQVEGEEIEILARAQIKPCICLRSNTFLGVGIPPVPEMIEAGLKPCLGTDSLASNDRLSIFAEMETIHRFFPHISPKTIVLMGTLWGAEALKRPDLGGIWRGFRADLVALKLCEGTPKDLYEYVITVPKGEIIRLYG